MTGSPTRHLVVLIDAENMPAKYAEAIFDEVAKFGEASVRRLYGDVGQPGLGPWMDILADLAITPVHEPKNTTRKNAADISLVIDAMDLLLSGRFDGFVLVSSDADFTKLAKRIREQSIDVYGIGEKKTHKSFRMACKQFITVENLVRESDKPSEQDTKPKKATLHRASQLIANVIRESNDEDGWARLSWLGAQLVQRYPDFDQRTYGYAKLGDLVAAIDKFEIDGAGSDRRVRIKP